VLFIDGKGDRETMRRFHALMLDAGRRARLFPDEGYDGWRGSSADVAARLVEVIDFAQEGGLSDEVCVVLVMRPRCRVAVAA
jgi:hypothetical protein